LRLLRALDGVKGGSLPSEWLTVPAKRLATQMQRDGLVQWKNVNGNRHSLKGQRVFITDAGRAALTAGQREGQ